MWTRTAILITALVAVLTIARASAQPVQLTTNTVDSGFVVVRGPAGSFNVLIGSTTPERGGLYVCDENGDVQASMFVDPINDARGYISADEKNFRIANPRDPGTDIVYACIEGPEAAAYIRGTARLENGEAMIVLPPHFADVASPEGMTVQLTPRSAESRGLAVVAESTEQIAVRELFDGRGSYEFHWQVTAVRRGHEQYEVIRPKLRVPASRPRQSQGTETGVTPELPKSASGSTVQVIDGEHACRTQEAHDPQIPETVPRRTVAADRDHRCTLVGPPTRVRDRGPLGLLRTLSHAVEAD